MMSRLEELILFITPVYWFTTCLNLTQHLNYVQMYVLKTFHGPQSSVTHPLTQHEVYIYAEYLHIHPSRPFF